MSRKWTENELSIALALYCKMPFGQFHQGNPFIQKVASLMDRTPSSLAMKLCNLASLDPAITESGRAGLKGASRLDRKIWEKFSNDTENWMPKLESDLETLMSSMPNSFATGFTGVEEPPDFSAENMHHWSISREGQNLFRAAVLSAYQWRCCITGVAEPRLLIAGHICPWSQDKRNRLNPRNGLCLSALMDRAFDSGLITLSKDLLLVLSPELERSQSNDHIREAFYSREGKPISLAEKFAPDPELLAWHRSNVFIQ